MLPDVMAGSARLDAAGAPIGERPIVAAMTSAPATCRTRLSVRPELGTDRRKRGSEGQLGN